MRHKCEMCVKGAIVTTLALQDLPQVTTYHGENSLGSFSRSGNRLDKKKAKQLYETEVCAQI